MELNLAVDPLLACAGLTTDELVEMLALVAGTDI
jgi:hypothetical protein